MKVPNEQPPLVEEEPAGIQPSDGAQTGAEESSAAGRDNDQRWEILVASGNDIY